MERTGGSKEVRVRLWPLRPSGLLGRSFLLGAVLDSFHFANAPVNSNSPDAMSASGSGVPVSLAMPRRSIGKVATLLRGSIRANETCIRPCQCNQEFCLSAYPPGLLPGRRASRHHLCLA